MSHDLNFPPQKQWTNFPSARARLAKCMLAIMEFQEKKEGVSCRKYLITETGPTHLSNSVIHPLNTPSKYTR